jgi:hypothetical protein
MFSCASAALIFWAVASPRSPASPVGPGAPDQDRGPSAATATGGPDVVPRPRLAGADTSTAPAPASAAEPTRKTGVALAQSYRDDICGCDTKACWREVTAGYRKSVGLAVSRVPEEAEIIKAALRETAGCIRRIDAAAQEQLD